MVEACNELANCVLSEISGPGKLAANGDPGPPIKLWSGTVKCLLERDVTYSARTNREYSEPKTLLEIFDAAGAPALEVAGSVTTGGTVLLEDLTGVTPKKVRFRVKGIERVSENTLDKVMLDLENEVIQ